MGHNTINEHLRKQLAEAHKRIAELEKAVETSRLKAEESFQNIETIVQALLNSSLRAIYLIDTSGTLLAMNDTGASRFGSQVSAMFGRCLYDFMPLTSLKAVGRTWNR